MDPAVLPANPALNQADALGSRSAQDVARRMVEDHRKALQARRVRDLVAEKILLHIDGSGDNQWAEVYRDQRVAIPRDLPEPRITKNLLQPVIKNQIAYHTGMPLRFIAEHKQSRESRERAVIDAALVNFIARRQRINTIDAQAMLWANAFGFCPVYSVWRDDLGYDPYEPLYTSTESQDGLQMPRKGTIDVWVGNPGDTTFNAGARRGSVQIMRYGRPVSAQMVRDRFGVDLEGTTRLPAASAFQRIARKWGDLTGLGAHGGPALRGGDGHEELIALLCQEIAPGVDPDWPQGRLTLVAIPGSAETKEGGHGGKHAILLADQPLPGGRFSANLLYSDPTRADDVHGGAWAEPLSDLQVQLNIARSDRRAWIEKMKRAPIITSGPVTNDAARFDGWTILEGEGGAPVSARVMEMGTSVIQALDSEIEEIEQAIYTIGGYQAASRGESDAGDPYAKVALLQQADDTIHGTTNADYRERFCVERAELWWTLMKQYGDVGWQIDAVGDEFEMLPEEYIDRTMLSDQPPTFRVVSGYGTTPEIKGRQLLDMVQRTGADGEPLLSTDQFREKWPDASLYDGKENPKDAQRKRARTIANKIRRLAKDFRVQNQIPEGELDPQMAGQMGGWVFQQAEMLYPRKRSDDLQANIDALVQVVQDETEDPIARAAAEMRLDQFYEWQTMMAMAGVMPGAEEPQGNAGKQPTETPIEQDPAQMMAEQQAQPSAA